MIQYSSGKEIRLGDRVRFKDKFGTVMFVIERDEWSAEFPSRDWAYLERGFMVKEDDGTLIHYETADACIELVSRWSGDAA